MIELALDITVEFIPSTMLVLTAVNDSKLLKELPPSMVGVAALEFVSCRGVKVVAAIGTVEI
jgi:hypothetical protein